MSEQINFWDFKNKKCECGNDSEFIYKNTEYCSSCIIKKLKIKVVDYIKYYKNGIFLGDANFDLIKVFRKVDSTIECK